MCRRFAKEAALSGTFIKGRSLMLNGAVLSIERQRPRLKNVTVEGTVRLRGIRTRRTWR